DEVAAISGPSAHNQGCDRVVLTKVIAAIAAGRHRRVEARYLQKQYVDKPSAVADASVAAVDGDVVEGGAVDEEEDIFADAGVDYQVNDENENEAVTAPYPESEDEDEGVTAPYPASEGEEDEVTAPYPASEGEEVVAPVGNPDNDISSDDDNDAALFSMARSRFKEETSELLSRQQPDSTHSDTPK
ncbi:hypothetical protein IW146_009108, partial [Coemansia sp. RSA 922]